MANQILFSASIAPVNAAMEVTINSGSSYAALTFTTVGSNQQGTLTAVPGALYAINSVGMRAVGYPNTALFNQTAFTVTGAAAAATVTPTSATPS